MKLVIGLLVYMFCVNSFAFTDCFNQAVTAAAGEAHATSVLHGIRKISGSKSYLVKYEVVLADSSEDPRIFETYDVTLMKSDCSTVSVIPRM